MSYNSEHIDLILEASKSIRMDARCHPATMQVYINKVNEIKGVLDNKLDMMETKLRLSLLREQKRGM